MQEKINKMEKYEFTVDNKALIELDPNKKYILSIPIALDDGDYTPERLAKLTNDIISTIGNNVVVIPVPYQIITIPDSPEKESKFIW